jgi:hypothetical protein
MKTTGKHAAFLFALVILALLVACKSKPIKALPPTAETCDESNPFVGLWEMSGRVYDGGRHIYKIMDDNRWETYIVHPDGVITPDYYIRGTIYTIRGSALFLTYMHCHEGDHAPTYGTFPARFDGDVLKIYQRKLRRVPVDCGAIK